MWTPVGPCARACFEESLYGDRPFPEPSVDVSPLRRFSKIPTIPLLHLLCTIPDFHLLVHPPTAPLQPAFTALFVSRTRVTKALAPLRRSADAQYLAIASQDGYCTIVAFEDGELGELMPLQGEAQPFFERIGVAVIEQLFRQQNLVL